MNMKKTMAAIAAGAVAVSAMATTVSAEDAKATWGDKVVSFNLVKAVESKTYKAKLHIEQTNIKAEVGDVVRVYVPYLHQEDVITINGEYANNNSMTFKPMTFNYKNGSAAAQFAFKNSAGITTDNCAGTGSYIEIPVVDANTDAAFTIKGVSGATASGAIVKTTVIADANGGVVQASGLEKIQNALVGLRSDTYTLTRTATAKTWAVTTNTGASTGRNVILDTTDVKQVATPATDATVAEGDMIVVEYTDNTQMNNSGVNLYIDIEKGKLPDDINDNDKAMAATRGARTVATMPNSLKIKLEVGHTGAYTAWETNANTLDVKATVEESKKVTLTPYMTNYYSGASTVRDYDIPYYSGDALDHVYEAKFDGTNAKIPAATVSNIINDAINHYGNVAFKFNAATKPVDIQNAWNYGNYSEDWMSGDAKKDYSKFDKNWWDLTNGQYAFDAQNYWINDWSQMNLFKGALVVNSNLTFSLATAESLAWNGTSLTFDWDDIQANALNPNAYTNYIQSMVLRTGTLWFWESFDLILAEGETETVDANAPDEADPGEILDTEDDGEEEDDGEDEDDGEEEDDGEDEDDGEEEDDGEDEDDGEEDDGNVADEQESNNPKTGNSAVALAVIPVALAAAAVVAKKRG